VRVLGIDPGSRITGFGVVEKRGRDFCQLDAGTASPGAGDLARRLSDLAARLDLLLEQWRPEAMAVERAFVGKNATSALRLGEVRGALLAAAGRFGIPVVDYPPATVKVAVTGFGRAEKEAVARCVSQLLRTGHSAGDAADALAVAICHLTHTSFTRRLANAR
jgi:crossover junction endodeoxyribonuclease RuvC